MLPLTSPSNNLGLNLVTSNNLVIPPTYVPKPGHNVAGVRTESEEMSLLVSEEVRALCGLLRVLLLHLPSCGVLKAND